MLEEVCRMLEVPCFNITKVLIIKMKSFAAL